MEFYPVLIKAHGGFGYLTFTVCLLLLLLAVVRLIFKAELSGLVKGLGIAEHAAAGLLIVSGVAVWLIGPWPLTQGFILTGLVLGGVYIELAKRKAKAARADIANTGSWLLWQSVMTLILVAAFGLMMAKPF